MSDYDPFSEEVATDLLPIYRELRAAGGVHRLEQYHGWALPRFAEVWEVSCDRDSFSTAEGPVFMKDLVLQPPPAELGPLPEGSFLTFAQMDPPTHTQIRKILYPPLRQRPVAEIEAELRRVAAECVDAGLERGRLDIVTKLASPVSVAGTSLILGFGHGLHYCIGAHLARLEGRVIIEEALARIPDFDVPPDGVVRLPGSFQQGYASVPIVF